jgi:hypothetical protein
MTALTSAITTAEAVKNDAAATQTAVDNAVTALNGAVTTFNTAKKDGANTEIVAADKTALDTAISEANSAKSGVTIDTDAANVLVGSKWVTQEEMTALTDAISTAETVKNNAAATQTEVNSAVTTLDNAVSAFNAAKQDGTNTSIVSADKTALETAIGRANTAKADVVINTDAANVSVGTKWVTQTDLDTFNMAITAAEGVKNKVAATQTEVNSAVTTLDNAVSVFNDAKQDGTKTGITPPTINAETPAISGHPQNATYTKDTEATLTVTAGVSDGGVLSYQWYKAADNTAAGEQIGTNSASYAPSTANVGTLYYYVVVTNTNNSVNGTKTALATSNRAAVTISAGVSVRFNGLPEDQTFTVSRETGTISWKVNTAINLTGPDDFDTYAWDVDGKAVAGATTNTLTLHAQTYAMGTHTVTVKVTKSGKTYAKWAQFEIEE